MVFNKFIGSCELNLDTIEFVDNSIVVCYGGGKGGTVNTSAPVIPEPVQEEASLDIEEKDKKTVVGKSTLKIPKTVSSDTGLNV